MKVALYEISDSTSRYKYLKESTEYMEKNKDYVRVSNIVELDFIMLEEATIIPQKVEALRAKKIIMCATIEEEISMLLAITHNPEDHQKDDDIPF